MVVIGMSVFLGFVCRRSPRLLGVSLVQSLQDFANKLLTKVFFYFLLIILCCVLSYYHLEVQVSLHSPFNPYFYAPWHRVFARASELLIRLSSSWEPGDVSQ